ncbi:MAG: prenyltransferase, partial [bacterium]
EIIAEVDNSIPMRKKIKGYFMLFRILPVLVWSFTGTLVGTALAVLHNSEINWLAFLLVLTISALVQGYPTHIINEIMDWKSGADSHELQAKKVGGSKVLQAKLLDSKDLWTAFAISHLLLLFLIIICFLVINLKIIFYFILPGYFSGMLYSLPPFRFSYRPFLGEWLGGFAGMVFLVSGSFYAQTLSLSPLAILTAFGLGLVYISIMTFFHYLDFEHDQLSWPKKKTTVVYLGLKRSRTYANICLLLATIVFVVCIFAFQIQHIVLLLLSATLLLAHNRTDLWHSDSIIKWGKVITYSTIISGLSFAGLANPFLLFMVLPVLFSFWSHKKFGKIRGLQVEIPT